MQTQRNAEGVVQAMARFRNSGSGSLSNVGLQAAVPKSQKLQLLNISSTEVGPGQEATQMMRVTGAKGVSFTVFSPSSIATLPGTMLNWSDGSLTLNISSPYVCG